MAVSQNGTPNMSVNVAAGQAIIDGTENAVTQGSYIVTNDATVNLAVAASDPTNPRNDLVVAKVQDAFYSGGTNAWSLAVITGTPAGSPVDPATPANSITLARIRVDALATTIVNAKITDLRADSDGAIFPGAAGWTLWDSTGALKNAAVTDAGAWTLRNGLYVPPSAGAALAPSALYGTVTVKLDDQPTDNTVTNISVAIPSGALFPIIELFITGRTSDAAAQILNVQFNGDVAGNYDTINQQDVNTTQTGNPPTIAGTAIQIPLLSPSGAVAGSVGTVKVTIMNADSATLYKQLLYETVHWNANSAAGSVLIQGGGQWRNTSAAITSIKFTAATGNLVKFRAIVYGRP